MSSLNSKRLANRRPLILFLMSDFLQKLNASSLSDEAKASLKKLYEAVGITPALRDAVSQAFQLQIEQTAQEAGVSLADDPVLKQMNEDYEEDVAVLMASFQATIEDQLVKAKSGINGLQPELDTAMTDKIRMDLP